jgi:hypothetical protein
MIVTTKMLAVKMLFYLMKRLLKTNFSAGHASWVWAIGLLIIDRGLSLAAK